jgi:hypothetical protein
MYGKHNIFVYIRELDFTIVAYLKSGQLACVEDRYESIWSRAPRIGIGPVLGVDLKSSVVRLTALLCIIGFLGVAHV